MGAIYRDFVGRHQPISAAPSETTLRQYAQWARDILHWRDPATPSDVFARFARVRLAGQAAGHDLESIYAAFANGRDFTPEQVRVMLAERAAGEVNPKAATDTAGPTSGVDPLITALEAKIAEWGGTDAEITRVIWQVYSGDGARKARQALMGALTGKKTPAAQCGVSALEQAYRAWKTHQTSLPAEAEQPPATSLQPARPESETRQPAQTGAANTTTSSRRKKAEPEGQLSLF